MWLEIALNPIFELIVGVFRWQELHDFTDADSMIAEWCCEIHVLTNFEFVATHIGPPPWNRGSAPLRRAAGNKMATSTEAAYEMPRSASL